MVAISVSAEAKISIGLSTSVLSSKPTNASIAKLEKELSKTAGDSVEIRLFNDEASVANWLLRFQQIDGAIVSANFVKQQPAGALAHLADLHFSQTSKQRLAVTTRLNLIGNQKDQLTKAFLSLSKSAGGLDALNNLALAGATAPGGKLVRKVAKKTTPATTKPAVTKPDKPAPKVKKAVKLPTEEKKAEEKPAAKVIPQPKPAPA
ncbi:MAG: hypothetical protein GWO23_00050, partial [Gammaproteobacteria bacterium]|nr:hypothetical protein [Gammaproteobacteria bacterium]